MPDSCTTSDVQRLSRRRAVSLRAGTWLCATLFVLDLVAIIVGAVAYGLTETEYEPGLKLVFSGLGHHVQRLEIAMVSRQASCSLSGVFRGNTKLIITWYLT